LEIKELAKKMDTMDHKITYYVANTISEIHKNNDLSEESSWHLHLTSIEHLVLVEEKLSDK